MVERTNGRYGPMVVASIATLVGAGAACNGATAPSQTEASMTTADAVRRDDDIEFAYVDVSGQQRTFTVQVRRPSVAVDPAGAPVLVWSHGGADGKDGAGAIDRVGDGWSRAFTDAGYVVVAIAHHGRDLESRNRLCETLGVSACDTFLYLTWDRPHDARVVFDWLETIDADGEPLDLDRLVYGGHSSGSTSVLTIGGLTGTIPGNRQPGDDPRPKALIAASPASPAGLGVDADSFVSVDRPVLVLTGVGDDTDGASGPDRAETFELISSPEDRLVWVDDEQARHTTFDLDTSACRRAGGTRAHCRDLVGALAGAAVSYVDAVLSGNDMARWTGPQLPAAVEWRSPR